MDLVFLFWSIAIGIVAGAGLHVLALLVVQAASDAADTAVRAVLIAYNGDYVA